MQIELFNFGNTTLRNLTPAQFAGTKAEKEFSGQLATTGGKLQLVS